MRIDILLFITIETYLLLYGVYGQGKKVKLLTIISPATVCLIRV